MMSYVYGAAAAALLIMGLTTWWALSARDEAVKALAAYEASAAAVIAERISAQEAEKARNLRKNEEITNVYRTRLAALQSRLASTTAERDTVAGRLRDALAAGPAPAVPGTSADAAGVEPGSDRDALLAELAGCLKNEEHVRAILQWYRGTH